MARGFLRVDKWKCLDVLISVHNWIIEIVENTLPRKLLWEKFENLNCFDFAWAYGLTWTHRDNKGITTNNFINLFRVVLNSDKTKLNEKIFKHRTEKMIDLITSSFHFFRINVFNRNSPKWIILKKFCVFCKNVEEFEDIVPKDQCERFLPKIKKREIMLKS